MDRLQAIFGIFNQRMRRQALAICLVAAAVLPMGGDQSLLDMKRQALGSQIAFAATVTGLQSGVFTIDGDVILAMARVKRHDYLAKPYSAFAYFNVALPGGDGDSMIPEPFVSALMIHLLAIRPGDRVMEIGFDSGYDAAVIAQLAGRVYSISQTDRAAGPLPVTRHGNIFRRDSGAALGWAEAGPFDAILVRQSMREPPLALLRQLKPGGRLVIPIGAAGERQRLTVFTTGPGGLARKETLSLKVAPLLDGREI